MADLAATAERLGQSDSVGALRQEDWFLDQANDSRLELESAGEGSLWMGGDCGA